MASEKEFDTTDAWLNARFVPGQLYQMTGIVDDAKNRENMGWAPITSYWMWHHKTHVGILAPHGIWVMFLGQSLKPKYTDWIVVLHNGRIWHTSAYNFEEHLTDIGVLWPTWFEDRNSSV